MQNYNFAKTIFVNSIFAKFKFIISFFHVFLQKFLFAGNSNNNLKPII